MHDIPLIAIDTDKPQRRRTQIRLAQRAYRQRKESTLDALRRQVSELQNTISIMDETFQSFTEKCLAEASHMSPNILAELKEASDQYATLLSTSDCAKDDTHESSSSMSEVEKRLSVVDTLSQETYDAGANHGKSKRKAAPAATESNIHANSAVWGYTITDQHPVQTAHLRSDNPRQIDQTEVSARKDTATYDTPVDSALRPLSHTMTLSHTPYSYNFSETTLARCLHRSSCEYAYRISCNTDIPSEIFNQIFNIWMRWVPSLSQVQEVLRSILRKGVDEPLSNWTFPLSHIGGAGTHYPRQEVAGQWTDKPGSEDWSVRLTSAPPIALGSSADGSYDVQRAMMDLVNSDPEYQGEWMDAYDVEGYLAEKGVRVHPQQSFTSIDMPVLEVLGGQNAELSRTMGTNVNPSHNNTRVSTNPGSTTGHLAMDPLYGLASAAPQNIYNEFGIDFPMSTPVVGYSDAATGSFMNMMPSAYQPSSSSTSFAGGVYSSTPAAPATKTVTIDVTKLIMSESIPFKFLIGYTPTFPIFLVLALRLFRASPFQCTFPPLFTPPLSSCNANPSTDHQKRKKKKKEKTSKTKPVPLNQTAIAKSGRCLGRSPGYRREKVDAALRECIVHEL